MTMETTSNPPFASDMKRRQNHHRRRMAEAATAEPPPSRHRRPLPTQPGWLAARRREPQSAKRPRCIEPSHMQRVNYCRPCAIGGRSLSPWIVFLPTCSPPLSTSAIEASAMAISAPRAAPRPFGASVVITTSDYPHSWPTPATGSRFLHRQHIEKAEQRSRGGGGKIFYRGIRGNGYRYRGAKSGSRSDLSARHDSSKAIMSSQSSATKSHLGAAGIGLFVLYWLMHPTVTANSGLAGYRPPPKTIVMLFREQVPQVGFYRIQWNSGSP